MPSVQVVVLDEDQEDDYFDRVSWNQSDELIWSVIRYQPFFLLYITALKSYFRVKYGVKGAVRNRFAEREAEELKKLIAQLDRINFSWVFSKNFVDMSGIQSFFL